MRELKAKLEGKVEKRINRYLEEFNSESLSAAIGRFTGYRFLLWILADCIWTINIFLSLLPLHTLNWVWLMYILATVGSIALVLSVVVNRMLINLTTRRTDNSQDDRIEILSDMKKTMNKQAATIVGAISGLIVSFTIIPFIQYLMDNPNQGFTRAQVEMIVGRGGLVINLLMFLIPVAFSVFLYVIASSDESVNRPEIESWMRTYEYHNEKIEDTLSGGRTPDYEPKIDIGRSQEDGHEVIQTVIARRQNTVLYGPIGSGKTSTVFKPFIRQDIRSYLMYIRDYETASKDPTWGQPHGLASRYLNGFNVIDPTNDLCSDIYEMCMEYGVPKDKVIWLDPENKDTPSMNLLRGPVEKAAENVSNIINGLKSGNNDFFQQSERTHLKNMVYLLKLSAVMDGSIASFAELMEMYNDVELVWDKMQILDKYCDALIEKTNSAKQDFDDDPEDQDKQSYYLEMKDKYAVAWQTSQWFHRTIQPVKIGKNLAVYSDGPHQGHVRHFDTQDEFVHGLTNLLDDISKNIPIRRVLFRDSGDFNLDDFLKNGGILLCNTAKAVVGDQLAEILGQVYTLSFQAATFRRKPNCEPMHPLYGDEFPDYLSEGFKDYAAQARKYNVPIIIAAQSPAQLQYKYGLPYFNTLMSVMLTRITFGDLGRADAELLAPLFGERTETVLSANEQKISTISGQVHNRQMIGTRKETVPNITPAQIMGLERFTIAVRVPGPHASIMFNRIRVKRVTSKDIQADPMRFSMDDPEDKQSYEYMETNQVHDNPDFDAIDRAIMTDPEFKVGVAAKQKETTSDEDTNASVASRKIGEMLSTDAPLFDGDKDGDSSTADGEITLSQDGVDSDLTSVGKNDVKAKVQFDDQPIVPSSSKPLTREEALAGVTQFIQSKNKQISFDSADSNIGSRKIAKEEKNDQNSQSTKKQVTQSIDSPKNDSEQRDIDPNPIVDENTNGSSNGSQKPDMGSEGDANKMMYIDKNNAVVVDKKDRHLVQEERNQQEETRLHNYKKAALTSLMDDIKTITTNPVTGTSQKIQELEFLKNTTAEKLSTLFPNNLDKILNSTINAAIKKQKKALNAGNSVMHGYDSFYTGKQKAADLAKKKQFQNDFDAVMSQMDDDER